MFEKGKAFKAILVNNAFIKEQKTPGFEVRVKGLSRDDPVEFLESDLQNIFRECGDIKYFHWITPKANVKYQGPHGHLGNI